MKKRIMEAGALAGVGMLAGVFVAGSSFAAGILNHVAGATVSNTPVTDVYACVTRNEAQAKADCRRNLATLETALVAQKLTVLSTEGCEVAGEKEECGVAAVDLDGEVTSFKLGTSGRIHFIR